MVRRVRLTLSDGPEYLPVCTINT
ncbi:uncharacterized protein METZ01_LOCUS23779 [marine metagenome]|uniref:Uncharacterized protein n=1 Tax=marine metagenome TaxID=408172 RepID=A0A381PV53_9ZZZZ